MRKHILDEDHPETRTKFFLTNTPCTRSKYKKLGQEPLEWENRRNKRRNRNVKCVNRKIDFDKELIKATSQTNTSEETAKNEEKNESTESVVTNLGLNIDVLDIASSDLDSSSELEEPEIIEDIAEIAFIKTPKIVEKKISSPTQETFNLSSDSGVLEDLNPAPAIPAPREQFRSSPESSSFTAYSELRPTPETPFYSTPVKSRPGITFSPKQESKTITTTSSLKVSKTVNFGSPMDDQPSSPWVRSAVDEDTLRRTINQIPDKKTQARLTRLWL